MIEKYQQMPDSKLMTNQRKEALFNCEMLKCGKKILKAKDYSFVELVERKKKEKKNYSGTMKSHHL